MNNIKKLTTRQKCDLRGKAHSLKPIVIIGTHGLTTSVHKEIDYALNDHELIKIRINANDKNDRKELIQKICEYQLAELIQLVGHVATIHRTKLDLNSKLKSIGLIVRKIINVVSQNENIKKAYIYDSQANGNHSELSNIDVAIDCSEISTQAWGDISDGIKNIDTLSNFNLIKLNKDDANLQREILKHGIKIYDQQSI